MTNQSITNIVATLLNEINVDGETMENIINQAGMRDQMVKQLITDKEEMGDGIIVASFTKDALIEYTREIQSRALEAVKEAVKGSGVTDLVTARSAGSTIAVCSEALTVVKLEPLTLALLVVKLV